MSFTPALSQLSQDVERLCAFERPSASKGEQRAAQMISTQLSKLGWATRVEQERAHGQYWSPMMLASLGSAAAAKLSSRAPKTAALLATALAAGVWDDLSGGRQWMRRPLQNRTTYNAIAELGPEDADRTVILVAHHDAAQSGAIFNPAIPNWISQRFPATADQKSSPPLMWPVFAGPALVAAGGWLGRSWLRRAGGVISAGAAAVFAEIGSRRVVPGANDNLTGVACVLALGQALAEDPLKHTRVILLSTGSEESFMEGMQGFARRHFSSLDPKRTLVIGLDTLGSRQLCSLKAEGMLRTWPYHAEARARLAQAAKGLDISLDSDVVLRNATDALMALRAGIPALMIGSYSDHGAPANYHWPTDTPENVEYQQVADATRLCETLLRQLDGWWITPDNPSTVADVWPDQLDGESVPVVAAKALDALRGAH